MKKLNPNAKCPDKIPAYLCVTQTYGSETLWRHPNGGGWVSERADVDPSVCVTSNAKVLGYSVLTGEVDITGDSKIVDTKVHGGINGVRIVSTIMERSQVVRDDTMPKDAPSIISASVAWRADIVNPGIIHDQNLEQEEYAA